MERGVPNVLYTVFCTWYTFCVLENSKHCSCLIGVSVIDSQRAVHGGHTVSAAYSLYKGFGGYLWHEKYMYSWTTSITNSWTRRKRRGVLSGKLWVAEEGGAKENEVKISKDEEMIQGMKPFNGRDGLIYRLMLMCISWHFVFFVRFIKIK